MFQYNRLCASPCVLQTLCFSGGSGEGPGGSGSPLIFGPKTRERPLIFIPWSGSAIVLAESMVKEVNRKI